jgi:transcriptional regulator with XRE-family HTH domain
MTTPTPRQPTGELTEQPAVPAVPVQLGPSAELTKLLRTWRERLDPHSIAGLGGESLRRRAVSQELVAHLVGVSPAWYGKLERGEREPNYSQEFLERVAYVLQLSDDERAVLYLHAEGRLPAPRVRATGAGIVNDTLTQLVADQPWPAYISDQSWDMLVYNRPMAAWFPHLEYERNVMRWVFYYPASKLQLIDWETAWAPPMLAQMRAAIARWPDNKRLAGLVRESLSVNEYAHHLWQAQPTVYVHPDGDRRRLNLPFDQGERLVEIVALTPMRADDMRMIILMPVEPDVGAARRSPP